MQRFQFHSDPLSDPVQRKAKAPSCVRCQLTCVRPDFDRTGSVSSTTNTFFLQTVQTGSGAYTHSYAMAKRGSGAYTHSYAMAKRGSGPYTHSYAMAKRGSYLASKAAGI